MKKSGIVFICLMVAMVLTISSCSTAKATETLLIQNTKTDIVETKVPATSTPTATATEVPLIPCTFTFDSDRDGNLEIYSMAPDGTNTKNLTNNAADDVEPAWSPDGTKIVFVSNRPQEQQEGGNYLYVMDADGSNVHQLTFEKESKQPDWSHDGIQITYSNKGDIYIIKADGSSQSVNLTNSPEKDEKPTWSPDGSQIAWLSGNDRKWNINVMKADGSDKQQMTANGDASNITWTIDGELFSNWRQPDGICFNCVMRADGTNVRDAGGKGELQRYMPFRTLEGDRVECISGDFNKGNEEIFLVSEIYPDIFLNLTNNPGNDRNPDWPANCLAGFEGVTPEETSVPVTEPTEAVNITIGYAGDDPAQWQRKNDFDKACSELGIQCLYGEIPDLLNQNVNAIVLNSSPENSINASPAIKDAVNKGIPVFVLDAEINLKGIYSVTVNQGNMYRATLDHLFKDSGGVGELAYFDFNPTQRDAELLKAILEKEYPKIKVVTTDTKRYNFNENDTVFKELLNDYPSLKAVWTNDGYTNAIFGIVNNISDPTKYPKLKCGDFKDGFFIWKDRLVDFPKFECISVSNPPGIAYDAAYAAYFIANGSEINESALGGDFGNAFIVDFPVITNENLLEELEKIQFEKSDHVVDRLMTPDEIKKKWFQ